MQDSPKSPSFTQFFGVDAIFGEICVVEDADNKLGGPRLIQDSRSAYLLGTALNMHEMSTDS